MPVQTPEVKTTQTYESIPEGDEKKFLVALAVQISKVYKHKHNLPPELKIPEGKDGEASFRDSLGGHHASPNLKFIHTLHRKLIVGTGNATYLVQSGSPTIEGTKATDWKKIAAEIHEFIARDVNTLTQPPKSFNLLSVDPVKLAGDAVNNSIGVIEKAYKTYSVVPRAEASEANRPPTS